MVEPEATVEPGDCSVGSSIPGTKISRDQVEAAPNNRMANGDINPTNCKKVTTNGASRSSSRKRKAPGDDDATSRAYASASVPPPNSLSIDVENLRPNGSKSKSSTPRRSPRVEATASVDSVDNKSTRRKSLRRDFCYGDNGISTNNGDEQPATRAAVCRHSSRSRMPRVKYEEEFGSPSLLQTAVDETNAPIDSNSEGANSHGVVSIDAAASMLAILDQRGHQRRLLCDADDLFRRVIQPLSLPWMHKGNPIARNIAFDIDDMTETLMADDGFYTPFSNGPLGYGRFDTGQLRRGPHNTRLATSADSLCSSIRRSDDPGVMEVSSLVLPLYNAPKPLPENGESSINSFCDIAKETCSCWRNQAISAGEIALQYHEVSSRCKRARTSVIRSSARKQFVSVKVNSTSSRSSIFTNVETSEDTAHSTFFLEAALPAETQNGKYLSSVKAKEVAETLGSYDWRHGLAKTSTVGKNSRGTSCGRTRLVWTEKDRNEHPQKGIFNSMLTGARLDANVHKRPRDVKVGIRVEGELFSGLDSVEVKVTEKLAVDPRYDHVGATCTLDVDEFLNKIMDNSRRLSNDRSKSRSRANSLSPILECLPDNNGLIGVTCSSTGKIPINSVHACLNHAAKSTSLRRCTVCWAPDIESKNRVQECSDCGVMVHPLCCADQGELFQVPILNSEPAEMWRCAVCRFKITQQNSTEVSGMSTTIEQPKKSRRMVKLPQWLQDSHIDNTLPAGRPDHLPGELPSHGTKCEICPYEGGAMSQVTNGEKPTWMHEVCRLWRKGQGKKDPVHHRPCALCGQSEKLTASRDSAGYLVKCAAARCQVYFHPMCALVSSKLPESLRESSPSATCHPDSRQGIDQRIASTFVLTAVECETEIPPRGGQAPIKRRIRLPIAYCGIHNPGREPAMRGLYPGALNIDNSTLRLPSLL